MKSDRARLIECITCKYIETCEQEDANAYALEDDEGKCRKYKLDEEWLDSIRR